MSKPLIIGLTGGIASGKTTVADLFHDQFGIDLVDADVVAREVVEPGTPGLTAIADHFGSAVLLADGTLNRAALREKIFSSPEDKAWLNALLHPMIREEMLAQLRQINSPYGLLVVPLLIENNLQTMADRVLVVDVSEEVQLKRTMERDNVPETQARAILAAQLSRAERVAHADDVIINEGNSEQLLSTVAQLHKKYLAYCD